MSRSEVEFYLGRIMAGLFVLVAVSYFYGLLRSGLSTASIWWVLYHAALGTYGVVYLFVPRFQRALPRLWVVLFVLFFLMTADFSCIGLDMQGPRVRKFESSTDGTIPAIAWSEDAIESVQATSAQGLMDQSLVSVFTIVAPDGKNLLVLQVPKLARIKAEWEIGVSKGIGTIIFVTDFYQNQEGVGIYTKEGETQNLQTLLYHEEVYEVTPATYTVEVKVWYNGTSAQKEFVVEVK